MIELDLLVQVFGIELIRFLLQPDDVPVLALFALLSEVQVRIGQKTSEEVQLVLIDQQLLIIELVDLGHCQ